MRAILVVVALGACGGGDAGITNEAHRKASDDLMAEVYRKVCDDAVEQYAIARRNGSRIDTCVHAGFVAAAFLQAKDEASYAKWKGIETTNCSEAGIAK